MLTLLLLITNLLASLSGCPLPSLFAGKPSFAIGACNRAALLPRQSSCFFLCGHLAALCSSLSQIQHLTLVRFGSGSPEAASCAVRFACHHVHTITKCRAGPDMKDQENTSPFAPFPFPFDLPLFPLPLPLCENVQMYDVFRPYFHAWQVSDVCPGFPQ